MTIATRSGPPLTVDADVLVIGAGVAGLCAALAAAPRRVLLLCPSEPLGAASSALAQGGIAAPLGPRDSVRSHVRDTLDAAAHSADAEVVARVIGDAAGAIAFLESIGVAFDAAADARSLHLEAGHSHARVLHALGDRSGAAMIAALWARALGAAHLEVLTGWRASRLVTDRTPAVVGALAGDAGGNVARIRARDTVLATGGIGQLFRWTTNSPEATGEGLAMALAVGARLAALEFVQFHPTALAVEADPLPLLTEALRGAGARLVTADGEPFMKNVHPRADLAPRDVVARAVYERTLTGERVWLDAMDIFRGRQAEAFPQARATARRFGFDPAATPLPVTAAAHYHMGGAVVDARGRTTVEGLWACGEVACTGLHGANRLASNSLLEAVHYGRAVGRALAESPRSARRIRCGTALSGADAVPPLRVDEPLRARIWDALGPVRSGDMLSAAIAASAADLKSTPEEASVRRNRLTLVLAMLEAAIAREESRGAHWRRDFPTRDPRRDGPLATHPWQARPTTDARHRERRAEPAVPGPNS